MAATHRVTIIGHVDVNKKPDDLPFKIRQVFNVEGTDAQVNDFVDARMADIIGSGAIKALDNPDHREIGKLLPWKAVPLHMLTHISFEVKTLTGENPLFDKEKKTSVVKGGKKAVVN